ncbi:hypothetical protein Tco_0458791 [Tanacetum coccineum]
MFNIWLEKPDIGQVVEGAWNKEVKIKRPDCRFRDKLKKVKEELRKWSKERFGAFKEKIEVLKKEAMRWELEAENRSLNEIERAEWMFWEILKTELINAVNWFWNKSEISRGCNATFVTLIPKVADPIGLGDFCPISLIGCYYKIIAKMLVVSIKKVTGKLVGDVQNAFIKDIFILDGILIANESMEYLKKNRQKESRSNESTTTATAIDGNLERSEQVKTLKVLSHVIAVKLRCGCLGSKEY